MTNQTVDAFHYLYNKHRTAIAIVVRSWESQQSMPNNFQTPTPPQLQPTVTLTTLTNCYYYYTFDWAPGERVSDRVRRSCDAQVFRHRKLVIGNVVGRPS